MGKVEEVYLLALAQSFLFTWVLRGFTCHILLKVLFSYYILLASCGKRCIKSTLSRVEYCRVFSNNHGLLRLQRFTLQCYYFFLTPTFSYCRSGSDHYCWGLVIETNLYSLQSWLRVAFAHRYDTNLRNEGLLSFFDINILYRM